MSFRKADVLKKKMILIAGDITSSFFLNELLYLEKFFDDIVIFSFGKKNREAKVLIEQHNLNCYFISASKIKIKSVLNFLRWFKFPYVRKEIFRCLEGAKSILKIGYLCYYGYYYTLTEPLLIQEVKNYKADIYMYSFWLSRGAFCVANIKEQYKEKIKYAFSRAHGYDLYLERNLAQYLPFRSYIASQLDAIYFISKAGMEYFKRDIGESVKQKKICALKVSYLGTNNRLNISKKIYSKKSIIIASCSSIINIKRLDLIIDTLSFLQNRGLKIKWIHIGDGKLYKKIRTQAQKKMSEKSFLFLGKVKNSQILQIYQKYDVDYFINLSDSEGVPVAIMEALSIGLPVIARKVGGNSEIVDSNCGCLLSEPLNQSSMFAEIFQFVSMRFLSLETYMQFSEESKKKWKKIFSADDNYNQFCHDLVSRNI